MREGLPSIMGLERDPFIDCPREPGLRCNCYKLTPCPDCPIESIDSDTKRMKCKHCGSEKGHWESIYDWHCDDCGKVTVD